MKQLQNPMHVLRETFEMFMPGGPKCGMTKITIDFIATIIKCGGIEWDSNFLVDFKILSILRIIVKTLLYS